MVFGDIAEITAPSRGFEAGIRGIIVSVDELTERVTLAIECEGPTPLLVPFEQRLVQRLPA